MATYRILRPDEFPRLAFVFDAMKTPLPRAGQDQVVIGEEDGKIVAVIPVQMLPHVSFWTDSEWKGKRDYELMSNLVEVIVQTSGLNGYAMTTDNEIVKAVARRIGMRDTEMSFYVKKFGGG